LRYTQHDCPGDDSSFTLPFESVPVFEPWRSLFKTRELKRYDLEAKLCNALQVPRGETATTRAFVLTLCLVVAQAWAEDQFNPHRPRALLTDALGSLSLDEILVLAGDLRATKRVQVSSTTLEEVRYVIIDAVARFMEPRTRAVLQRADRAVRRSAAA